MWETIKTTWSFLTRRQKITFGILTGAQLFANVLDLVGIAAIGLLVMAVASGEIDFDFGGLYRLRIEETPPELIAGLVVAAALLAVATGGYSADALRNAGAVSVFESLADTDSVVRALTGPRG